VNSLVYVPNTGSKRMNDAVSVIAIILLIALLFVGMKFLKEDGFYKEQECDWQRGYIDLETGKVVQDGFFDGESYGMYTAEAIKIGHGVRIDLKFGSTLTFQVLIYDENDKYLGTFGDPHANGMKLFAEDLNGEFSTAHYIRIYAYENDVELENGNPSNAEFSGFDMIFKATHIKVYALEKSNIEDNIDDIT